METINDIAGIGIGPFNLGLAALGTPVKNLKTIFIDAKPSFNWHEGMMIPRTTLQVPYLADLVTLADPTSQFSYLNFLRAQNRLLQFGVYEKNYIARSEYNRYCKWVADQLENLKFNIRASDIRFNHEQDCFEITCRNVSDHVASIIKAKHIVLGVGTKPYIPACADKLLNATVIHSSDYMHLREGAINSGKIVLIGSGQSAAEIFYDLLNIVDLSSTQLNWITRSDRFYAMENSRLNYEMTSPGYIDFFYSLDPGIKQQLLNKQFSLYKGINSLLIDAIYDKLYDLFTEKLKSHITIRPHSELQNIIPANNEEYSLLFHHNAQMKNYELTADFIILATGYKYEIPSCIRNIKDLVQFDAEGRYLVNRNYSIDGHNRIFVQNAEIHTHGFNAPDLGLGAYRNAVILNNILGQKHYPVDEATSFQSFGIAV